MDYLSGVRIASHDSWAKFETWRMAAQRRLVLLTTSGETNLWDFAFARGDVILVGRELAGVPESVAQQPMRACEYQSCRRYGR